MSALLAVYLLCGLAVALALIRRRRTAGVSLPPGPPADPIIGHVRVFPNKSQATVFKQWAEIYGDIMYVKVAGQSMVILNSYEDAVQLLEKRSANYSDRSECTTFQLMGYTAFTAFTRYGNQWRTHRRLMQEKMQLKSCIAYQECQLREVKILLQKLSGLKGSCDSAVERFATAISLETIYGHHVTSDDDEYIAIARGAAHALEAAQPGTTLLDILPFLQYIPRWLPGCGVFTEVPLKLYPAVRKAYEYPFGVIQRRMASGQVAPSFVSYHLGKLERNEFKQHTTLDVRDAAAGLLLGAFDTTTAALSTFIAAMILFPDVQRKAQRELDVVIGSHRLPDFNDRPSLPYIECLIQEVYRWNPVVPLGVPHRSMQDDVYKGMFIPKDTLVIGNALGMNRNERLYREPDTFNPARFLPKPEGYGEKHYNAAFGFGRRICPGRHLADANLWIAVVNMLMVFNIESITDKDGQPIFPEVSFTESLISHPSSFECVIVPRSEEAVSLIAVGVL